MNIGIYGGSFNPIHYGHTGLAKWIVEHTDIDCVWLMVSPNNPLKDSSILADERTRLHDAQQAVKDIEGVEVSDFEFALPKPTYTANTLRELSKAYPQHHFTLIIGEDNWAIRDKWREWDWIEANYPILVYPREGFHSGIALDAPLFPISSTQIRAEQQQLSEK